jgi:hypothetical protein
MGGNKGQRTMNLGDLIDDLLELASTHGPKLEVVSEEDDKLIGVEFTEDPRPAVVVEFDG